MKDTEVKRLLYQDSEAFKAGIEVGRKEICDRLRELKCGYENDLDTEPRVYERHIQLCAKTSLIKKLESEVDELIKEMENTTIRFDDWRKIERDKDGFATDTCLDRMYQLLPLAIKRKGWHIIELACEDNWSEVRGDIDLHPYYEYYCTLPQLPHEEEKDC